jgi:hypothetical protein
MKVLMWWSDNLEMFQFNGEVILQDTILPYQAAFKIQQCEYIRHLHRPIYKLLAEERDMWRKAN